MSASIVYKLVSDRDESLSYIGRFGSYTSSQSGNSSTVWEVPDPSHSDFTEATNLFKEDVFANAGDSATLYVAYSNLSASHKSGITIRLMHTDANNWCYFSIYNKEFGIGLFARTTVERGLYLFIPPTCATALIQTLTAGSSTGCFEKLLKRLKPFYELKGTTFLYTMTTTQHALFIPYMKLLADDEFADTPVNYENYEGHWYSNCNILSDNPTPANLKYELNYNGYNPNLGMMMPGLTTLWNWWTLVKGSPALNTSYIKDYEGNRIYLARSTSVAENINRNVAQISGSNTVRDVFEANARDYQVGTNLSALLTNSSAGIITDKGMYVDIIQKQAGNMTESGRNYDYIIRMRKTVENVDYITGCEFNNALQTGGGSNVGILGDFADNFEDMLHNYNPSTTALRGFYLTNSWSTRRFMNTYFWLSELYNGDLTLPSSEIVRIVNSGATEYPNYTNIGTSFPYIPIKLASLSNSSISFLNDGVTTYGEKAVTTLVTGSYYNFGSTSASNRLVAYNATLADLNLQQFMTTGIEWATFWGGEGAEYDPEEEGGEGGEGGGEGGGDAGGDPQGGDGDFDDSSDEIDDIGDTGYNLPPHSLYTLYKMGQGTGDASSATLNMANLTAWIYEQGHYVDDRVQYVNNIISLKEIFSPSGQGPTTGSSQQVYLADAALEVVGTAGAHVNIYGTPVSKFVCEFTVGNISVNEYYGGTMDYAPNTNIEIYLPFCGLKKLDTNVVMNSTLTVKCTIDFLTGMVVYNVIVRKIYEESELNSTIYTFNGNCAVDYPVTALDYSGKISGLMSTLVSGATMGAAVLSGGIGAVGVAGGLGLMNSVNQTQGAPGRVQGGQLATIAGVLAPKQAYLIIERPYRKLADDYGKTKGFPSDMSARLGDLSGFTRVKECNLEYLSNATQDEYDEIEQLLKSGVIL